MEENRGRLLKSIYRICFSVLTVLLGGLFIAQAWAIFRSAPEKAYTVARINQSFKEVCIPIICWVIALVGNIVIGCIYPDPKEKVTAYFGDGTKLNRLKKRLSKDSVAFKWDGYVISRVLLTAVAFVVVAVSLGVSLGLLLDPNYETVFKTSFFMENNGMADRVLRVLVWVSVGMIFAMAVAVFVSYAEKKREEKIKKEMADIAARKKRGEPILVGREGELYKLYVATEWLKALYNKVEDFFQKPIVLWLIRGAFLLVAIVFIVWGICNGGMASVLEKAINICTQCIGLG